MLKEIPLNRLFANDNLMQSDVWAISKRMVGMQPRAITDSDGRTTLVLLQRRDSAGWGAYVPWGPRVPERLQSPHYLEDFAVRLSHLLPSRCAYIRFDLPWRSPWMDNGPAGDRGELPPRSSREIAFNFGTRFHAFRKAPSDVQPVATSLVNLGDDDEDLLRCMRPKTRYNIRLAERRHVRVREASPRELSRWYRIYRETMERHDKPVHDSRHFLALFEAARRTGDAAALPHEPEADHHVRLLLAERDGLPLAGMVLAVSGPYAIYLYGASRSTGREHMPVYLLQWRAMQIARDLGAQTYDLFGIPADNRRSHPMHGLLRFKESFGGSRVVRRGCWDFVLDGDRYRALAAHEAADGGYHR
jgi:lipid II:glycine glycyltransferase (peptidoglycan interpeptide bridge formation enzyme)